MTETPGEYRKPSPGDLAGRFAPPGADVTRLLNSLKSAHAPAAPAPGAFLPADPFGKADGAGIALAEMYRSMLAGGIPLASVEKILGHMLASLPSQDDQRPGGV